MRVTCGDAFTMFDFDHLAIGTRGPRERHDTTSHGVNVAARPAAEVDAVVPRRLAGNRIDAVAKARGNPAPIQRPPRGCNLVPEAAACKH